MELILESVLILRPLLYQKFFIKKLTLDWSIFPLELQNLIYEYLIETELSLHECISQNMKYESMSRNSSMMVIIPEGFYSLTIRDPYFFFANYAFISFDEYPSTFYGTKRWTLDYRSRKECFTQKDFFPLDSTCTSGNKKREINNFKDKNIQKKEEDEKEEHHNFTLLEIFVNLKKYMDKYPQNSSKVIFLNEFFIRLNLFYFCNKFFVSLK